MNHSAPLQCFKARRTATPFPPQHTGIDVVLGDYDEERAEINFYYEGEEISEAKQFNWFVSTKMAFMWSNRLINEPLVRADMPEIKKMDQKIAMHVYEDVALVAMDYN